MASLGTSATKGWAAIALLVLKGLLALAFLAAAWLKLRGEEKMVAEFGQIGLGQWFRFVTGVIELCGAGLLLWPRTAFYGALICSASAPAPCWRSWGRCMATSSMFSFWVFCLA